MYNIDYFNIQMVGRPIPIHGQFKKILILIHPVINYINNHF